MESKPLQGVVIIKNGSVTLLKNLSEMNVAIVDYADPVKVLATIANAGWRLGGDYELSVYKKDEQ
jgi:hypothetical protein